MAVVASDALLSSCCSLNRSQPLLLRPSPFSVSSAFPSPALSLSRKGRVISIAGHLIRTTMAAVRSSTDNELRPVGVLFVCLGNICRSPTAEAVFRYAVDKRGLAAHFNIDSAGTIDYHEGEPSDARMKAAAKKRGINLTSISRPIHPSDFEEFDIILAMDRKNQEDILKAHRQWSTRRELPPNSEKKVKLMCEYCKEHEETEVPDPYYGGPAGFEKVLDLLEDACESLLDSLLPRIGGKIPKEI